MFLNKRRGFFLSTWRAEWEKITLNSSHQIDLYWARIFCNNFHSISRKSWFKNKICQTNPHAIDKMASVPTSFKAFQFVLRRSNYNSYCMEGSLITGKLMLGFKFIQNYFILVQSSLLLSSEENTIFSTNPIWTSNSFRLYFNFILRNSLCYLSPQLERALER